jgi:hypothetical protein
MTYLDELRDVIKRLHGSDASHVETVPVKEVFQGQTVWEGEVEVFDLHSHPEASRVYAWSHETEDADNPKRHITVLHIPPVVSPQAAVRAAIIQEYRREHGTEES